MINDNEDSIQGFYRHFKGEIYIVFGNGMNTETEESYVLYKRLIEAREETFFVRPTESFFSNVTTDEGTVARFSKLSEDETLEIFNKMIDEISDTETEELDLPTCCQNKAEGSTECGCSSE